MDWIVPAVAVGLIALVIFLLARSRGRRSGDGGSHGGGFYDSGDGGGGGGGD